MGQCGTVQQNFQRQERRQTLNQNTLRQSPSNQQFFNIKDKNSRHSFSKITYIQHNDQLIYQFEQASRATQNLPIKKWQTYTNNQSQANSNYKNTLQVLSSQKKSSLKQKQLVVLSQSISDNIFITDSNIILNIFSFVDQSLCGKQFMSVAQLYYQLNQLKQNLKNLKAIMKRQLYVLPENIYVKSSSQDQQASIIIKSQRFQHELVSLKQLGRHMHLNGIQWQDGQFLCIIQECFSAIRLLHQQNYYIFQQFFIDTQGNCFCLGGFTSRKSEDSPLQRRDISHFYQYLTTTLYGDSKYLNQTLREEAQSKFKFKHSQSIQRLKQISQSYGLKSTTPIIQDVNTKSKYLSLIETYIQSFKAKNNTKLSEEIALGYNILGQLYRCKEILVELYSLSLYNQVSQNPIMQSNHNMKLKLKSHKQFVTNSQAKNQNCLQLFIKIINLQKKIMKIQSNTEIEQLCHEFVKIVLFLAKKQTVQGNYLRSLAILQKIHQTMGDDQILQGISQHWAVAIEKADNYYFLQDMQKAQKLYNKAFQNQLNETTLCKIVNFYTSVLNWEHSIAILRQYESVIQEHYLYQFFIGKCIMTKSLCILPSLKEKQQQRNHLLNQSLRILRRVLERKFKNNILLIQIYQAIGDCYFYMMNFQDALQNYSKSLALIQSQQSQNKHNNKFYEKLNYQNLQQPNEVIRISHSGSKNKEQNAAKSILNTSISFSNTAPSFQNFQALNLNKKSIILSSIGNIYLMQKKYDLCLNTYEKARKNLNNQNNTLKNSIIGNMGICLVKMGRRQEGRETIKHILKDLDRKKTQNDINYIFLREQCKR